MVYFVITFVANTRPQSVPQFRNTYRLDNERECSMGYSGPWIEWGKKFHTP